MSKFAKCGVIFSRKVPDENEPHLDHRCRRPAIHVGPCECRCGARICFRDGEFTATGDGRVPTIRLRGKGTWHSIGCGLEVSLLEFGSQDDGWAWIQVREVETTPDITAKFLADAHPTPGGAP